MGHMYILVNGEPVPTDDPLEWVRHFEEFEKERRIGLTFVGDYGVSTVFLGIDHNFLKIDGDDPILFETMIYRRGGDFLDYQERYRTLEEARLGHERAIAYVEETYGVKREYEVEGGDEDGS